MNQTSKIPGSFRDPSGFLFLHKDTIYRQVNNSFREEWDHFISSGLYKELAQSKLLVEHEEADIALAQTQDAYRIIRPQAIPFISYPYEWCFSQLKDAALTTIAIQKRALDFGMSLKDCSAYNIQFIGCRPVFIDTLSFERYRPGRPWIAYRQFCQHFLAPLALMSNTDIRLSNLLKIYIDGIPLDLASRLLPFKTRLSLPLFLHIHLHSSSQRYFSDKNLRVKERSISMNSFLGLIDSLESAVKRMRWGNRKTEWGGYYEQTNYSQESMEHKKEIVSNFIRHAGPVTVWDMGANTGVFSLIAGEHSKYVVSFDSDPAAVEKNFFLGHKAGRENILPLIVDLSNPSPGIGWENTEREPLLKRGPADMALALALIHHIAISNNVPLHKCAEFFSSVCNWLAIEFVPKSDSQVVRLLSTRKDIFTEYDRRNFEDAFCRLFFIEKSVPVKGSQRTMYLMKKR